MECKEDDGVKVMRDGNAVHNVKLEWKLDVESVSIRKGCLLKIAAGSKII